MTLEDFLLRDRCEEYDFKNEISVTKNANEEKKAIVDVVRREKSKIEKFLLYYDTKSIKFDCDSSDGSCDLANEVYDALWGWHFSGTRDIPDRLAKELGGYWGKYGLGSDTMNSFMTTYRHAHSIYKDAEQNPFLIEFAGLTHSIGNFTLVPFKLSPHEHLSFNQSRGWRGEYYVKDYWDLSLKLLKENFGDDTFKSYIKSFFLNDYVDENNNILPLFDRHKEFLKKDKILPHTNVNEFLPKDVTELNEYLQNVNEIIISRGKNMVDELRKKRISMKVLP